MDVSPIEVQRNLKGVDYPARRNDLLARAEENGAGEELLDALRELPEAHFDGPDDVMERLGSR